jgi:hypothetical protein
MFRGSRGDDGEKLAGIEWSSGPMSPYTVSAPYILCGNFLRSKCGHVNVRDW